uniref:Uncharacterized protein n=1 Tax=Anopheles culicifacies TaxID=139723 RepID=A0A182MHP1_9DIPT
MKTKKTKQQETEPEKRKSASEFTAHHITLVREQLQPIQVAPALQRVERVQYGTNDRLIAGVVQQRVPVRVHDRKELLRLYDGAILLIRQGSGIRLDEILPVVVQYIVQQLEQPV